MNTVDYEALPEVVGAVFDLLKESAGAEEEMVSVDLVDGVTEVPLALRTEGSVTRVQATWLERNLRTAVAGHSFDPGPFYFGINSGSVVLRALNSTVTLTAVGGGLAPLSYQWFHGSEAIAGATEAQLRLGPLSATDAGSYSVVISNASGSVTSAVSELTVDTANSAPYVITAPQSQVVSVGAAVVFSVEVGGIPAPTYQWRFNGGTLPGQTASTLTLSSVEVSHAGVYTVTISNRVTNAAGSTNYSATSPDARLVVTQRGYGDWSAGYFSIAQLAETAVSGATADPDADGLSNLFEYALGLDPTRAAASAVSEVTSDGLEWFFRYSRPADRPDLTYVVEVSTDLATWSSEGVVHERLDASDEPQRWQARCAIAGRSNAFFRLKITR